MGESLDLVGEEEDLAVAVGGMGNGDGGLWQWIRCSVEHFTKCAAGDFYFVLTRWALKSKSRIFPVT